MTWHTKRTSKLHWRDLKGSATCVLATLAAATSSELAATTAENVGIAAKVCHIDKKEQAVVTAPCGAAGYARTAVPVRTLMASLMMAQR